MGKLLLRIAVIYFGAGTGLGMFMAISQDHTAAHVHGHVQLLGWVSLALCGLIHLTFPTLQRHWLAKAHFVLHNVGLPVGMISLFFLLRGHAELMPLVAIGASVSALGVVAFIALVMTQIGAAAPAKQ